MTSLETVSAPLAEQEDFTCDFTDDDVEPESAKEEDVSPGAVHDDGNTSPCENTDRESAVVDADTELHADSQLLDERDPGCADAQGNVESFDSADKVSGESADAEDSAKQESLDSASNAVEEDPSNRGAVESAEGDDGECLESTPSFVPQDPQDDSTEKLNHEAMESGDIAEEESADSTDKMNPKSDDSVDDERKQDPDDSTDKTSHESTLGVSGDFVEEPGSTLSSQATEVTEDSGGGVDSAGDSRSAQTSDDVLQQSVPTLPTASLHQHDDAQPSLGETTATQGETTQAGSGEATGELQNSMDAQGETNAGSGRMNDILDDFFGTSGTSDSALQINGVSRSGEARSSSRFDREKSPDIVVDSIDGVENVTLKDATSEKALLGNGESDGSSLRTDSVGSKTDEDKRKSSSDMDLDFAVLELDSSHLNLDLSKQKNSLRKRGSLARRKKPSRGSGNNIIPGSEDSIFQDSTVAKPVTSPTSEDEVFDPTPQLQLSAPQPAAPSEMPGVRKSAQPYKAPIVMPGLQDLSKSKLFSQERHRSGETESPTSPVTSPIRSPASPADRGVPPLVLPKPTSKGQKDWQNKTIAAETSSYNGDSTASSSALDELWSPGRGRAESDADSSNLTQTDSGLGSGSLADPKMGRKDSWSSVSSPRRLSRGDSMDGGEVVLPSTPRRASIQGSAYAPIGFRPRRSSSIVLDANNKLIDTPPAPPSPAPSSGIEEERGGAQSPVAATSGVKSPLYKAPVWLSEMKAKTGSTAGESSHPRTSSSGSTEESAASIASSRDRSESAASIASSRDRSESAGSTDGNAAEGGTRARSISDEMNLKKREQQEAQKPGWMKAAQEKTSRMADQLNSKKEGENGDEVDDEQPKPHWVTGLRKTNRPLVTPAESSGGVLVTPLKNSGASDKENQPVASDGRDQYAPSWMKRGQVKKAPVPLPGAAGKGVSTNGSGASENPMKAYETPRWKLELAEKKKRREAEMQTVGEETSDAADSASSVAPSGDSQPSDAPQWRQQLSQRKRRSIPGVVPEDDAEAGGEGPEWARKAEERRQRIIKSGLLEKAAKANGADES